MHTWLQLHSSPCIVNLLGYRRPRGRSEVEPHHLQINGARGHVPAVFDGHHGRSVAVGSLFRPRGRGLRRNRGLLSRPQIRSTGFRRGLPFSEQVFDSRRPPFRFLFIRLQFFRRLDGFSAALGVRFGGLLFFVGFKRLRLFGDFDRDALESALEHYVANGVFFLGVSCAVLVTLKKPI